MPRPRSTTTCSSMTPPWRACCRATGCAFPTITRKHPMSRRFPSIFPLPLIACIAITSAPAVAADYVQAGGSSLVFAGTYQGEVFTGRFPGFSTRLSFDPQQLAGAKLDVDIPLYTATTTNSDYDGEMRGDAFFDAARFPQAHYSATKFRSLGGNRYATDGTLSLHGISKPVTFTFTWTP